MVLDLYDLCAEDLKVTLKQHRNILTEREEVRLQNRHGVKGKVRPTCSSASLWRAPLLTALPFVLCLTNRRRKARRRRKRKDQWTLRRAFLLSGSRSLCKTKRASTNCTLSSPTRAVMPTADTMSRGPSNPKVHTIHTLPACPELGALASLSSHNTFCTDNWLQYDDDVVRHYKDNDIKQLVGKGGADWHIAYLCFYRTKKPE
jgi:hypothetical protein